MMKTGAVLLVTMATLAGCAQQQPAQNPQTGTNTPTESYPGTTIGATEQMPATGPMPTATGTPNAQTTESQPSPAPANEPSASAPPPQESWSDGQILETIHTANDGEIDQARLARTSATDARVKNFAAMMIRDHAAADEQVQTMASRPGMSLASNQTSGNLERAIRGNSSALRMKRGSDFDRSYVDLQVQEHQALLATIDNDLMPHAQSADMKHLLTKVRAKVLTHLQHAQDLEATLNR